MSSALERFLYFPVYILAGRASKTHMGPCTRAMAERLSLCAVWRVGVVGLGWRTVSMARHGFRLVAHKSQ